MTSEGRLASSFRDPSGFLYYKNGVLLRQINKAYSPCYQQLMESGLSQELTESQLLIPHQEKDLSLAFTNQAYRIIQPQPVEFISYPCEWCFSQLKAAALAMLAIQNAALAKGMILKDASAFNMQFHQGRPTLIDTLSFEPYKEGMPWEAYGQFCRHFLAPLALASLKDVRLLRLSSQYIDGIPVDLASGLLPVSLLKPGLLTHLHAHAKAVQTHASRKNAQANVGQVSKRGLLGLVHSLKKTIESLKPGKPKSPWIDYSTQESYHPESLEHKERLIKGYLDKIRPGSLWDIGANTGHYSRFSASRGITTLSLDADHDCIEKSWSTTQDEGFFNLLPLVFDLANPTPAIGWNSQERMTLEQRGPADMIMALALVHHIAIANNVLLEMMGEYFSNLCTYLVIEFVPKEDPGAQRLLVNRQDIFDNYNRESFQKAFEPFFHIVDCTPINKSMRTLFLLENRTQNQPSQ